MSVEEITVAPWPKPKGYANGMRGVGVPIHIAGQIGWNAQGQFDALTLIAQFAVARTPECEHGMAS